MGMTDVAPPRSLVTPPRSLVTPPRSLVTPPRSDVRLPSSLSGRSVVRLRMSVAVVVAGASVIVGVLESVAVAVSVPESVAVVVIPKSPARVLTASPTAEVTPPKSEVRPDMTFPSKFSSPADVVVAASVMVDEAEESVAVAVVVSVVETESVAVVPGSVVDVVPEFVVEVADVVPELVLDVVPVSVVVAVLVSVVVAVLVSVEVVVPSRIGTEMLRPTIQKTKSQNERVGFGLMN